MQNWAPPIVFIHLNWWQPTSSSCLNQKSGVIPICLFISFPTFTSPLCNSLETDPESNHVSPPPPLPPWPQPPSTLVWAVVVAQLVYLLPPSPIFGLLQNSSQSDPLKIWISYVALLFKTLQWLLISEISKSLNLLFPLPRTLFPQIASMFAPSLSSGLYSKCHLLSKTSCPLFLKL